MSILKPAIRLLARLRFPAKFALIGGIFVLTLGALVALIFSIQQEKIGFAAKERQGVAYLLKLNELTFSLPVHRRMVTSGEKERPQIWNRIEGEVAAITKVDGELAKDLGVEGRWGALAREISMLREASGADGVAAHNRVMDKVLEFSGEIGDKSGIVLDPDLDSYYLGDVALGKLLPLRDQLGRARVITLQVAKGAPEEAQRQRTLTLTLGAIDSYLGGVQDDLKPTKGFSNPDSKTLLERHLAATVKAVTDLRGMLDGAKDTSMGNQALQQAFLDAFKAVEDLYHGALPQMDKLLALRIQGAERQRWEVLAIALAATLVAAYLFGALYVSLVGALREVLEASQAMAEGDLSRTPRPYGQDEVAEVSRALGSTLDKLRGIAGELKDISLHLRDATGELSTGNADLSHRTERQAANVEEMASSTEEISATVDRTAEQALTAREGAKETLASIRQVQEAMEGLIQTMGSVREDSARIQEIITVVDEIAFQTNLLALNAAVEAARAGEQGRGFAVVASEVRNLAKRSADSAKEIKGLINVSVQRVGEGVKLAEHTGRLTRVSLEQVEGTTSLIQDIAGANQEQSSGVRTLHGGIAAIEESTQQNAALVEQTSAATLSLDEKAQQLAELVGFFQTGTEAPGRSTAPRPAPARSRVQAQGPAAVGNRPRPTLGNRGRR